MIPKVQGDRKALVASADAKSLSFNKSKRLSRWQPFVFIELQICLEELLDGSGSNIFIRAFNSHLDGVALLDAHTH